MIAGPSSTNTPKADRISGKTMWESASRRSRVPSRVGFDDRLAAPGRRVGPPARIQLRGGGCDTVPTSKMRWQRLLPATAVLLLEASAAAALTTAEPKTTAQKIATPPALTAELRDQYGRPDSFAAHHGRPRVVFVVSARRLRRLKDWEARLDRRLEGVVFMRVADVPPEPGQPPPRFEDVAATLRKRVPEEVPVLVDMERLFARDFEIDTRELNVLLFDAAGGPVGKVRGRPNADNLDMVTGRLLALPGVRRNSAATPPSR